MKKTIKTTLMALLLCVCMVFGLTACGGFTQDDIDNAVNDATATLNSQITALEADIAEKTAKITTLESEKTALTTEKGELEADIAALEAEKAALEADKAELEDEVDALEAEKKALADENAELEASITAKNTEIEALTSSVATLEAEKTTLNGRVTELNTQITTLNERIAELEAGGNANGTEITELKAKVATLESEKATLTARVTELEGTITEKNATIADLEADVATLTSAKADLEAQITTLNGTIATKNNEIDTLNSSISALNTEKANLTDRVGELEASIAEKDTAITNLNSSIATLTEEKQALTDRVAELEDENKKLEDEKSELEKENEALKNCLAGNHTGGEATCVSGKLCEICDVEYDLTKNPENHASDEFTYTDNGDGTHKKLYSCCDAVHTEAEEHNFADDLFCHCGVCRVDISHVNVTPWEDDGKLLDGSIGVFVTSPTGDSYSAENVKWTNNNGEWVLDDTTKVLFENNGERQQIAAYYPYMAEVTNNEIQITLPEAYGADYENYDYLYGDFHPLSSNPATIKLKHLMAKVTVNITKGSELKGDSVASVVLVNLPRTVTWTLPDAKLSGYGEHESIELYNNEGAYTGYALPNGSIDIALRITMASGRVFTETVSLDDLSTYDMTEVLSSGVHYKLDVKVGKDVVVIDGTLGGKTEATEEDLAAMVELLRSYIENGHTTFIVTGSQPALLLKDGYLIPVVSLAFEQLTYAYQDEKIDSYWGTVDLIYQDVTEIVEYEFYCCDVLKSITLPKVTTVGDRGFWACYYLETLTFGSVVTNITDNSGEVFYDLGYEIDGCNLVLNSEQADAATEYQPNIENRTWWNTEWKSITLE